MKFLKPCFCSTATSSSKLTQPTSHVQTELRSYMHRLRLRLADREVSASCLDETSVNGLDTFIKADKRLNDETRDEQLSQEHAP